jgi:hypothetical protein
MLMYEGVITRDNSITLERFLQTFYIVNDADATNFGIDKMTLQKYFNSLSTCVFIKPTKYIELIAVIPAVNLNGFIDLYQYIHRKLFPNSGGKRRKSISRTRGPSKHKRRRSSAKRTSTKPRHTTRRRRTKHRRH